MDGTWTQLKDRFLLGVGDTYKTVNSTGGEARHILTVNEMPSHQHIVSTGAKTVAWAPGNFVLSYQYQSQNPSATTEAVKNTGGSQAHNNMPPYLTVYMWKRTK